MTIHDGCSVCADIKNSAPRQCGLPPSVPLCFSGMQCTALQHRSRPAACIHTLAIRGVPLILLVFKPWLGWASILQRLLQHRHFGGLGKVIQIFIAFAMGRPPLPNAPNTSP